MLSSDCQLTDEVHIKLIKEWHSLDDEAIQTYCNFLLQILIEGFKDFLLINF